MTLKTPKEQAVTDLAAFYSTNLPEVEEVTYTPSGGEGATIPIRIDVSDESGMDPRPPKDSLNIRIQESDVAEPNVPHDIVTLNSETWYVVKFLGGPQVSGEWRLRISRSERLQL